MSAALAPVLTAIGIFALVVVLAAVLIGWLFSRSDWPWPRDDVYIPPTPSLWARATTYLNRLVHIRTGFFNWRKS